MQERLYADDFGQSHDARIESRTKFLFAHWPLNGGAPVRGLCRKRLWQKFEIGRRLEPPEHAPGKDQIMRRRKSAGYGGHSKGGG